MVQIKGSVIAHMRIMNLIVLIVTYRRILRLNIFVLIKGAFLDRKDQYSSAVLAHNDEWQKSN